LLVVLLICLMLLRLLGVDALRIVSTACLLAVLRGAALLDPPT
jgi:hypothetical protein